MDLAEISSELDTKENLLKNVKKEVKQIMEEAVTRKFIHEESSSVISLCGTVESCLQHGLKKRALGLFKNSTTTALLQKIAKNFEPAVQLLKILNDLERGHDQTRKSADSLSSSSSSSSSGHHYHHLMKRGSSKYIWIRIALYEKQLAKIVDYLVHNSNKYYEKEALISDPVCGAILASLLVGPCALEFTQMKTVDHLWTDPPAKELMQRHRIHSTAGHVPGTHADSPKRLALQVHKTSNSTSEECQRNIPFLAKEYVESLHQNSKSTLLYGKNNVIIQPKEDVEAMAGYLSLHQNQRDVVVKWTPNQLMNVSTDRSTAESVPSDRRPVFVKYSQSQKYLSMLNGKRSQYWNYALAISLDEIVYLHCHQQSESGGTVVLVGQDGVQRPPIHFPKGGHLWAFLSCIENGLAPDGRLEPPLSYHREEDAGELFPTLLKKKIGGASNVLSSLLGSMTDELTSAFNQSQSPAQDSTPPGLGSPKKTSQLLSQSSATDLHQNGNSNVTPLEASDYVFRIVIDTRNAYVIPESISEQDEKSIKEELLSSVDQTCLDSSLAVHRTAVRQLCSTMSSQILSRAFYGWLSHCRQLKTVRTHLSGLVHSTSDRSVQTTDSKKGLSRDTWNELMKGDSVCDEMLLHELIYFGGCDPELRKEVWPFLLEHYRMESDGHERADVDARVRSDYEAKMVEWSRVEKAIKYQEKDKLLTSNFAANVGSINHDSHPHKELLSDGSGGSALARKESSLSSDVFESVEGVEDASATPVVTATTHRLTANRTAVETLPTEPFSSSSLSSLVSSSSSSSTATQKGSQYPHHFSHHTHAKRMLDKSSKGSGRAKFTIGDDVSLDSTDSMKLDSVDSDISSSNNVNCASNGSSTNGNIGVPYSLQLLENFALNIHRIDKDVHRCDRNHSYFAQQCNLVKLRNIMCTYVWNNMDMGYVQGMCDLAAPLLVILEDEPTVYSCFSQNMKRMSANFPNGNAMDQHFGNMRSLIQIMDPELFEHMRQYGDYTHFYFCYRWFLLDFKRELVYSDVFKVWETIWSSKKVCSPHFVLFIALALLEYYREIIIDNRMDFTEIIKFFNELAERHNASEILSIARSLVGRLQELIENK